MAAINGANLTTLAKAVSTEQFDPSIIAAPAIVRCYEGVAAQRDASMSKGSAYVFVSFGAETLSGSQTETDELTANNISVEDGIATAGVVGDRKFVSDQGLQDAIVDQAAIFGHMAEIVRKRINKDICALASSAATETDKTGEEMTLTNFEAAQATYLALNPGTARNVAIFSANQIAHLRKAIRTAGNGGLLEGAGLDLFDHRPSAYQGNWGGFEIWLGDMPDDGVSDVAGMFVGCNEPITGLSGLGLAVWKPITPEIQRNPVRVGWEFVVSTRYGVCITADHMCHRVVTKKAL